MHKILCSFIVLQILLIGDAISQQVVFQLSAKENPIHDAIFEIVEVRDNRKKGEALGQIYTSAAQKSNVLLGNDINAELKKYFANSIRPQSGKNQQILVSIETFELSENKNAQNTTAGELKLKFGFYVKGSFEIVHLLDFEGGMSYRRSIHRTDLVQQVTQQALGKALEYFNEWIDSQALSNRSLAKSVKLIVEDGKNRSGRDTVFYDFDRALTWKDFTDRPRTGSRYNAVIFTSLAMEGKPFVEDGSIVMPLFIKVYMLPGQSWVKNKNDYSLNHEQRHFDVVKVVADRLKHSLNSLDVNPENYEALVNDAYFDAYREMNKLQELYDGQTNHGLKPDIQEKWNRMLDSALKGDWSELEMVLKGESL